MKISFLGEKPKELHRFDGGEVLHPPSQVLLNPIPRMDSFVSCSVKCFTPSKINVSQELKNKDKEKF